MTLDQLRLSAPSRSSRLCGANAEAWKGGILLFGDRGGFGGQAECPLFCPTEHEKQLREARTTQHHDGNGRMARVQVAAREIKKYLTMAIKDGCIHAELMAWPSLPTVVLNGIPLTASGSDEFWLFGVLIDSTGMIVGMSSHDMPGTVWQIASGLHGTWAFSVAGGSPDPRTFLHEVCISQYYFSPEAVASKNGSYQDCADGNYVFTYGGLAVVAVNIAPSLGATVEPKLRLASPPLRSGITASLLELLTA